MHLSISLIGHQTLYHSTSLFPLSRSFLKAVKGIDRVLTPAGSDSSRCFHSCKGSIVDASDVSLVLQPSSGILGGLHSGAVSGYEQRTEGSLNADSICVDSQVVMQVWFHCVDFPLLFHGHFPEQHCTVLVRGPRTQLEQDAKHQACTRQRKRADQNRSNLFV